MTVVEWVSAPLVPVTVTLYVPGSAVPGERVNVEVPFAGPTSTLAGASEAVDPSGLPTTVSETVPVKEPEGATVTVLLAGVPGALPTTAGAAATEKSSGGGVTGAAGASARAYAIS